MCLKGNYVFTFGSNYVFTFGKCKGKFLKIVLYEDPGYLIWCHHNIDWFELSDEMYQYADEISAEERNEGYNCLGDEFWRE